MSNETQTPPTATTNEGQAAVAQDVTAATAAVDSGQPQQAPATEAPATTATDTPTASVETAAKPAQAEGAPAAYEFTAPDGVTLDEQVVDAFKASAKELNLTNEAAQKLLSSMAPVMAARQADQLQAHQQEWRGQAEADQEIGGVKLTESLATAKKALSAYATPEFVTWLEQTGLGNHPEVIRTFYRAGKAISEDTLVTGTQRPAAQRDARSMYAASNMNP